MITRKVIRHFSVYLVLNLLMIQYLLAQEVSLHRDTIHLKYIFWSSPKYSLGKAIKFKNTNNNFTGTLNPDFKVLFNRDSEEYLYLQKTGKKFTIGNFAFAVPGAICLCFATASKDKNTRNAFLIGGSAFLMVDITLGINGFKDLKKAVCIRNKRILNN